MNLKKFTLIELLVVVAIIGILASMLMPALGKAREKTRVAVCISNLKQVGLAIEIYISDGKGTLPGPCYNGIGAGYRIYNNNITSYIAESAGFEKASSTPRLFSLLSCPSFTGAPSGVDVIDTVQFGTYGKDSYGEKYFGYPGSYAPKSISAVEDPTGQTAIAEIDKVLIPNAGWSENCSPTPRHGYTSGKANRTRLYFDGHSKIESTIPSDY